MENEQKFFVYVDFREDDGKPFYVGKGVEKRVKDLHRNPLHTNIKNKHGMVRKIVLETQSELESLEKEIQLIQELKTHIDFGEGGANLTLGGEGISGYKYTDDQKEERSKLSKKMWEDPEHREKLKQIYDSPDYKEKQSESCKKVWEDHEHREKMSELRKGMWKVSKFQEKMKERNKKMWEDPEIQEKHRESIKKKWEDPEYKEIFSKMLKKKWEDPEIRKKMSENIKLGKSKLTPEQRSEIVRKGWETNKLTPEQRSERIRKGWETRRLKKLQLSPDPLSEVIPE